MYYSEVKDDNARSIPRKIKKIKLESSINIKSSLDFLEFLDGVIKDKLEEKTKIKKQMMSLLERKDGILYKMKQLTTICLNIDKPLSIDYILVA